jgi:hypothetical protein
MPASSGRIVAMAAESSAAFLLCRDSINSEEHLEMVEVCGEGGANDWPKDENDEDVVLRLIHGPTNLAKVLGVTGRLEEFEAGRYVHW